MILMEEFCEVKTCLCSSKYFLSYVVVVGTVPIRVDLDSLPVIVYCIAPCEFIFALRISRSQINV